MKIFSLVFLAIFSLGLIMQLDQHFSIVEANEPLKIEPDVPNPIDLKIPMNLNLYLVETVKFRLSAASIDGLPEQVHFVIWPDSALIGKVKSYYLQTPPVDRMDAYALKNVVDDADDLYLKSFEGSRGIFVRNGDAISSPLSALIFQQLAFRKKTLVMISNALDAEQSKIINDTKLDFHHANVELMENGESGKISVQWDALKARALQEEMLDVYLLASESSLQNLREIFN